MGRGRLGIWKLGGELEGGMGWDGMDRWEKD